MIRVMFKQQLDEKSFREKRRITLQEVSDATGWRMVIRLMGLKMVST